MVKKIPQNKAVKSAANKKRKVGVNKSVQRTKAPVAIGNVTRYQKPRYINRGENVSIEHREYITDIVGATGEYSIVYQQLINPGNPSLFPWLSAIAKRFESYKFKKLKFCYETESPTSTPGFVSIVVDYDANDEAPTSKIVAFTYQGTVKGAPWQNFCHESTGDNLSKRKSYFVDDGNSTTDRTLLDTGQLFMASGGIADNPKIGELWVEYFIDLNTPQMTNNSVFQINSVRYAGVDNMAPALPFGTNPSVTSVGSPLLLRDAEKFFNVNSFPVTLQVSAHYVGTGITNMSVPVTGGTATSNGQVILASGLEGTEIYVINLDAGGFFSPNATATTITTSTLFVSLF